VRLSLLVVDLALVILTCLVVDHAYLQEAYRDHPFLVVDPCLEVYSMDVLEEGLSCRLEAFHLEAYRQEAYPLVVVHLGLELLEVCHLASCFIFFP
jgi:hypothetical protein